MSARDPLANAQAGSEWMGALLDLFWAVDAQVKERALLPLAVEKAYEAAEKARQKL